MLYKKHWLLLLLTCVTPQLNQCASGKTASELVNEIQQARKNKNWKQVLPLLREYQELLETQNFYERLGINENATQAEIDTALKDYNRKVAFDWHPDKWSLASQEIQEEASEIIKLLNQAKGTLEDPKKRSQYNFEQRGFIEHPIFTAIADMDFDEVKKIIKKNPNSVHETIGKLSTLHYAIQTHFYKLLLKFDQQINSTLINIIEQLIEAGAPLEAQARSTVHPTGTPLHFAVYYARPERSASMTISRILLNAGANVNAKDTEVGRTPLFYAKSPVVAGTLLRYGADPNEKNNFGNTVLHEARDKNLINRLLRKGIGQTEKPANINARNNKGETPLLYRLKQEYWIPALYLIEEGANVTTQDNDGNTPLHAAVNIYKKPYIPKDKEAAFKILEALVQAGANPLTANTQGETPLSLAQKAGLDDVIRLFQGKKKPSEPDLLHALQRLTVTLQQLEGSL